MDTEEAYTRWLEEPTPDRMAEVITTLEPTITSEVHRYSGPKPLMRSKGRSLAINAVKTYDPAKGAKLRSWTVTNLKPLSRYSHKIRAVRSPEVAVQQAAEVDSQRKQWVLDRGDEPTDVELADRVGISIKRVRDLRSRVRPIMQESAMVDRETGGTNLPPVSTQNKLDFASEAVYKHLTAREKTVFDLKVGTHGKTRVENQEIARRLGISPAAVSQLTSGISKRIREVAEDGV